VVDLSQNGNHDGCGRRIEEGKVTAMSKGLKGEYNHSVDSKGRMIVPSKLREQLGLSFVVTRGMDGCLFAYPNDEWEIFEGKLRQLPMTNENSRKFKRFFQAGAADCEVDNQGRILLPANLREFAGITKDVTVVGVGERAEIWSKEKWEEKNNIDDIDFNELAQGIEDLGIMI
jgi:MraZ protein